MRTVLRVVRSCKGTPFFHYRIPGVTLFAVLGVGPLVAVFAVARKAA